jgi:Cu/Ag efflux protein CusF
MKKKTMTLAALAIFTISLAALAADNPKSAAPGEKTATGTIAKVDTAGKSITVTGAKGASWTFQWNDSTKILGGELKEGTAVKVGYTEGDGKMWATWINVGEAAK